MDPFEVQIQSELEWVVEHLLGKKHDQEFLTRAGALLQSLLRHTMFTKARELAVHLRSLAPEDQDSFGMFLRVKVIEALSWGEPLPNVQARIEAFRTVAAGLPDSLNADLDLAEAWASFSAGQFERAAGLAGACEAKGPTAVGLDQAARASTILGSCSLRTGNAREAETWFQNATVLFRLASNTYGEISSITNQGLSLKNQLEWAASRYLLSRSIEMGSVAGASSLIAHAQVILAIVELKSGSVGPAQELFEQVLEVFRLSESLINVARSSLGAAQCYILTAENGLARRHLGNALEIAAQNGYSREEALAHEFTGDLHMEQGKAKDALPHYDQALEIGLRIAPRGDVVVEAQRRRGEALIALGRLDEASLALDQAEEIAAAIPEPYEAAVISRVRMTLCAARGNRKEIEKSYHQARERVWAMEEKIQRGRLLEGWARILQAWEENTTRREVLYEARNLYGAAGATGCFRRVSLELEWEKAAREEEAGKPRLRHGMLVAHSSTAYVLDQLERYKDSRLPVLVLGETGTGKELVARAAHEVRGGKGPWVAVNCGAMPRELVESELFGAARGAYTGAVTDRPGVFERANGGTLFLDEIGELPPGAQTRLLRVLETGEVCRIGDSFLRKVQIHLVAATHRDLKQGVQEGWFRSDLYYRLEGLVLEILPLRERREEIEHLGRHFLGALEHELGRTVQVDDGFWSELRVRQWPGNVRQLKRAVERAVMGLRPGQMLAAEHLGEGRPESWLKLGEDKEELERERVIRALTRADWNKSAAAALLGVKRTTLIGIMKRIGVPLQKEDHPS